MPDNKNQHYVPRCHLKPFTQNGAGLAINLFNHTGGRIVHGAPVKNQCSCSYFYGEDLVLEKLLQEEEGRYATVVRKIENGDAIGVDDRRVLRGFAYLQMNRTAAAVDRRREAIVAMDRVAHQGFEGMRRDVVETSHQSVMLAAIATWAKSMGHVSDLDVVLIRNDTGRNFITSDDPAALTNRVNLQRMKDQSFGVVSFGTQIIMPITTKVAMIAYDPAAYAPKGCRGGWIGTAKIQDVDAINEFQLLNSVANIYFRDDDDVVYIRGQFETAAARRPASRTRNWVGIQIEDEGRFERYRRATAEELQTRTPRITSTSPVFPVPSRWFSGLPFRLPMRAMTNGSGVGFVRRAHMKEGIRFELRDVPTRPLLGHDEDGPEIGYIRKQQNESKRKPMRARDLNELIRSVGSDFPRR